MDGLKAHCVKVEDKLALSEKEKTDKQVQIHTLQGQLNCEQALTQQLRERRPNAQPNTHNNSTPHHHQQANAETEVCEKEFLNRGSCTLKPCPFSHNIDRSKEGVCIIDFERKGECRKQDRCRFSHQTPTSLRNNESYKKIIMTRKEQTFGICFYDYLEQGSCPRSKQNKTCRFSHNCSQERRDNLHVRESILRRMRAKNFDIPMVRNDENRENNNGLEPKPIQPNVADPTLSNLDPTSSSFSMQHKGSHSSRTGIQAPPQFYPGEYPHLSPDSSLPNRHTRPLPPIQKPPTFSPMDQTLSSPYANVLKSSHANSDSFQHHQPLPHKTPANKQNKSSDSQSDINNLLCNTNFQKAIQNLIMTSLQQFLPPNLYPSQSPPLFYQGTPAAH